MVDESNSVDVVGNDDDDGNVFVIHAVSIPTRCQFWIAQCRDAEIMASFPQVKVASRSHNYMRELV